MNRNNKRTTLILGISCLLVIVGVVVWFLTRSDDDEPVFEAEMILAKHAISYNDDGVIQLYKVENGKKLDEFDLKTLSDEREITVEETGIEQVKPEEKAVVEEPKEESYKDFDIVWMTIEKGDNAWTIQSNLTPDRNPATMLDYVREINENYAMHPIYPGQKYAFLKEKGTTTDAQYGDKLTNAPEAFVEDMKNEIEVVEKEKEVVTKVEREEDYIFYQSQADKTLYAYSDFNQTIYSIEEKDGKLLVQEKWTNTGDIGSPVSFIFEDEVGYFEYAASNKLNVLEKGKKLTTINLEDVPSHRLVVDGLFVYTYGDFISTYDYKTNETKKATLGDKTKDLIELQGKVYAINAFGEKSVKNVLFKINPTDLYVDRLQEISSDEVTFASYGDAEDLWVSYIEKKKNLDGELVETELMNGVDTDKLKFNDELWAFDLLTISYSAKNYIYDVSTPEVVDIYEVMDATPVHTFKYEGDNLFVILPN